MVDETELEQPSTAPENDEQAQSSSAESETEDDLLAVVKAAVEVDQPTEADSQSGEVDEDYEEIEAEEEGSDDTEDDPIESTEEEIAAGTPYHKIPRFQKLIADVKEYRPKAEQYDQITGYLKTNNLSADEAAEGFKIMAMMKNDPEGAVLALQPYLKNLAQATGHRLPDDIQNRVDEGYMDESDAREMARLRASNERNAQRNAAMQHEAQRSNFIESQNQVVSAVENWESEVRSRDPDYDLKADELDDRVKVIMAERRAAGLNAPLSTSEALSIAKEAYNQVNKRTQARLGNRRPMRTASGGKLGGTPTPEPNSLMEAVQNALANGSA
jgi:hypothetical protein